MNKLALVLALASAAPVVAQPASSSAPAEPITVIHAGTLIAEAGKAPRRNASIVVRGRTIIEVRDGFVDLPGARVVDLRSATVLPGLIDSHVHLSGLDDRLQERLLAAGRDNEDEAFTAILNARKTLLAGFTTVRDLGGDPRLVLSLRDSINAGQFSGPTILSAALMVSVSGGHGDGRNGVNRGLASLVELPGNTCDGPDDCRRATREQVSAGADVIKFAATGGVLSNVPGGLNQQMMDDEMRAVVTTARTFGSPTKKASASTSRPALITYRPCWPPRRRSPTECAGP